MLEIYLIGVVVSLCFTTYEIITEKAAFSPLEIDFYVFTAFLSWIGLIMQIFITINIRK